MYADCQFLDQTGNYRAGISLHCNTPIRGLLKKIGQDEVLVMILESKRRENRDRCQPFFEASKCRQALIDSFIQKYGQTFQGVPLPGEIRKGTKKQCYSNALRLALDDELLTYAEGYVRTPEKFCVLHGWCVKDGNAIDPTLNHPEQCDYFGILIPMRMIAEDMNENRTSGILTPKNKNVAEFIDSWSKAHTPHEEP
jgi:hypothetical protein